MGIVTQARRVIRHIIGRVPAFVKAAPYMFDYAKSKPVWLMMNFMTYVTEGYESNPLIYQAIMYKIRAAAATRLRAYTGDASTQKIAPQTHPLSKLLARPNEHQSWTEFEGLNIAFLNVAGNAYIYLDRGKSGTGPIAAMYPLRPDRVRIIPDTRGIKAFVYIPKGQSAESGIPIMPDQIIHVKMPNLRDEFEGMGYGMSPMMPLSQSTDVDNGFTSFIKMLTERGLMPAGLLKFDDILDDDVVAEQRRRFQDRYGGIDNWGDVIVLDRNGDYKQIGMNFKDLDFQTLDKRTETRILGVLGVPVILLETVAGLESATFANKAEARRAFWEDVMAFELGIFDDEYTHYLNQPGVFVQRDYSNVPALQKNIPELVKAAYTLWTMGAPANQAVRTVGIRMDDIPGGDTVYIGGRAAGDDPVDAAAARLSGGNGQDEQDEELPDSEDENAQKDMQRRLPASASAQKDVQRSGLKRSGAKAWDEQKKSLVWKALDDLATSHEEAFGSAAAEAFEVDRRAMLALAQTAKEKSIRLKATINWLNLADDVTQYFRSSETTWRETFLPVMAGLVEDTGNYWAIELGMAFDVRNILGEAWFQNYTLTFAQPISATSSSTIHHILAQAQAEGWSIYEMTERLGLTFDQWTSGDVSAEDLAWLKDRTLPYRREMIGRTETTRLQNAGAQALFTHWGIKKKEWLATKDKRCRPSHRDADGQKRDMDKPFRVGGFDMMHPGDMSLGAPPKEIVLCRCAELPIIEDEDA